MKTFKATVPFSAERPQALVVCCSDGRWIAQVEEFVALRIARRADLYAVAGGPAGFDWYQSSLEECRMAENQVNFFAEHHRIRAVWLIAHQDCAWYALKYPSETPTQRRERQYADLSRADEIIARWHRHLEIIKVYASLQGTSVVFEEMVEATVK